MNNKNQAKREQLAHERSLRDAKRERLRSSYKVLLKAANAYQTEAKQMNHTASPANISLTGVEEAADEIELDDVSSDLLETFYDIRGAFHVLYANWSMPDEGSWPEVEKHKRIVSEKCEQLKEAMKRHLNELEY